jgi:thiamine-phosphate pyrophosphorylase
MPPPTTLRSGDEEVMRVSLRRHDPVQVQTVGGRREAHAALSARWAPVSFTISLMTERRARLGRAHLYFIGDATAVGATLEAALRGGADVFQLRDKNLADDDVLRVAADARALCHTHGALFVVNDRPDLAAEADADGVHVGQDDASVEQARAAVGNDRLIGLSTHTPQQVDDAHGVDLIGVGPVHSTPTKEGRPAVGLDLIRHAAAHARMPWFAIGGLDEETLPAAVAAGATRASVVRAIAHARDPEATARRLRAMLTEARVGTART